MYVTKFTDDFDNNTSSKYTEYDIMTFSNCTYKENNIHIIIPTLLLTKPCGLSFLCLMSLLIYTLLKLLFNNKQMEKLL